MIFAVIAVQARAPVRAAATAARADPRVAALLDRALDAHGGAALTRLRTLRESAELTGSGPLGMRVPSIQLEITLDRGTASGRHQIVRDGVTRAIFQQTPQGGVAGWTEKAGRRQFGAAEPGVPFVPPLKTGVVGLLALRDAPADELAFVERGEVKGKKGPMIVRTRSAPHGALILRGRGEFVLEPCQTTWSYLFAPDGTLIAERIVQKQAERTAESEMSFDRFESFGGVKLPTEVSLKHNQVPRNVSLKIKVKQAAVDAPVTPDAFRLPGGQGGSGDAI